VRLGPPWTNDHRVWDRPRPVSLARRMSGTPSGTRGRDLPDLRDHRTGRFEGFFAELVDLGRDSAIFDDMFGRDAFELNPASAPDLVARFGLRFPGDTLSRSPTSRSVRLATLSVGRDIWSVQWRCGTMWRRTR
jgi:hypothetical protein